MKKFCNRCTELENQVSDLQDENYTLMSHVATHVTRDPEAEFQLSQLMEQVAANDACIA